jgi:hypothetical protein
MPKQTWLFKRRRSIVVSTLLLGWMVLNSSTPAFADKKRNGWNGQSRFSDSGKCRTGVRQDRSYQRDNYYRRNAYYQPARDYRQDRSYQRCRSDNRGYNQYRGSNRNWNEGRYRGYKEERSTAESALIIAGSSGAGAAVGGLLGGTKGAAVGAIVGGVAGVVYDQATDNRR